MLLREVTKVPGGAVGSWVLVPMVPMVPAVYLVPVVYVVPAVYVVLAVYLVPAVFLCVGMLKAARLDDKMGFTRVYVSGFCEVQVPAKKMILRFEYPSFCRKHS